MKEIGIESLRQFEKMENLIEWMYLGRIHFEATIP